MTAEEILSSLNPEQAEAVSTLDGALLVLAGAGTGKTRVITCRIAYMLQKGVIPETILGMTFTNKAAAEMRERLAALAGEEKARAVTLGTFHSFCVKLLRAEIGRLGYLPGFTIADEADQQGLVKQAAGVLGFTGENFPLAEMAGRIGRWKNRLVGPDEALDTAENTFDRDAARLYREYQSTLERQNTIDFDDMLYLAYRVLDEFPEALEKYRSRYHYILIDEYQDTNDAQFTLVKMLAETSGNICAVGDDDQSIYSWRGANVSLILDFERFFPGAKIIKLEQNYRCSENILAAANAVIASNARRHGKKLWSALGKGDLVTVVECAGGDSEAELVCSLIRQEKSDRPDLKYSDFAVLYRSNHLSREIEMAMRRSELPMRLVGGQEFFKRKEVRDAASYLKILLNPRDDQSLLRILATPPRGLADKAVSELKRFRREKNRPMSELLLDSDLLGALTPKAAASARELGECFRRHREIFREKGRVAERVRGYLEAVGYLGGLQKIYRDMKDTEKRRDNVFEFINSAADFERRNPDCGLEDFMESFALLEENDRTEDRSKDGDAVTLSTVHAAKGLEYKVVIVVALEKGIFPNERALEEGSGDEELRLFYVAITRAKEKLFLLRARERMVRGMRSTQLPSPFLRLLNGGMCESAEPHELIKEATDEQKREAFADIFAMLRKRKLEKKSFR